MLKNRAQASAEISFLRMFSACRTERQAAGSDKKNPSWFQGSRVLMVKKILQLQKEDSGSKSQP